LSIRLSDYAAIQCALLRERERRVSRRRELSATVLRMVDHSGRTSDLGKRKKHSVQSNSSDLKARGGKTPFLGNSMIDRIDRRRIDLAGEFASELLRTTAT